MDKVLFFKMDAHIRDFTMQEAKKGLGGSVVFVARNRFVFLDNIHNQVIIKNLKMKPRKS